jgi:antirestriction protein
MQIYIADLEAYNAGKLEGVWTDPYVSHIEAAIEDLKENNPDAESFVVHDYDGFPNLGEISDWEMIEKVALLIDEHGDAFLAYLEYHDNCLDYALDHAECFEGVYDDEEDFARQKYEYDAPEEFVEYIDWQALGSDRLSDYTAYHEYEGSLYVWR